MLVFNPFINRFKGNLKVNGDGWFDDILRREYGMVKFNSSRKYNQWSIEDKPSLCLEHKDWLKLATILYGHQLTFKDHWDIYMAFCIAAFTAQSTELGAGEQ